MSEQPPLWEWTHDEPHFRETPNSCDCICQCQCPVCVKDWGYGKGKYCICPDCESHES